MTVSDTADTFTLTVTDRLEVLRPDGSMWEVCDGHTHDRTLVQVLGCLLWGSLVELPPADEHGPWVEPNRIVLPGVAPFVVVFHGGCVTGSQGGWDARHYYDVAFDQHHTQWSTPPAQSRYTAGHERYAHAVEVSDGIQCL